MLQAPSPDEFWLSIVIPTKSATKLLHELLVNFQNQIISGNYGEFVEVIVVFDGVCQPDWKVLVHSNLTIRVLQNSERQGAPYSRRRGLESASGRYVHFHDADDNVSLTWLAEMLDLVSCKNAPDLIATGRIEEFPTKVEKKFPGFAKKHENRPQKICRRLLVENCLGPLCGLTFRRSLLLNVKFRNFHSSQDWQVYLDYMNLVETVCVVPGILVVYRRGVLNSISSSSRRKILGYIELYNFIRQKYLFGFMFFPNYIYLILEENRKIAEKNIIRPYCYTCIRVYMELLKIMKKYNII